MVSAIKHFDYTLAVVIFAELVYKPAPTKFQEKINNFSMEKLPNQIIDSFRQISLPFLTIRIAFFGNDIQKLLLVTFCSDLEDYPGFIGQESSQTVPPLDKDSRRKLPPNLSAKRLPCFVPC